MEYDSKPNIMIGIVLPLHENGFPREKKNVFNKVADAEEAFMNNHMANNAYVFMAYPLSVVYGTDNIFSHQIRQFYLD